MIADQTNNIVEILGVVIPLAISLFALILQFRKDRREDESVTVNAATSLVGTSMDVIVSLKADITELREVQEAQEVKIKEQGEQIEKQLKLIEALQIENNHFKAGVQILSEQLINNGHTPKWIP